jgi:hypothetical protein
VSYVYNIYCLFDGVERHFQQYFSYIVAVSFIRGGNRMTRKKTCRKSLTTLKKKNIVLKVDNVLTYICYAFFQGLVKSHRSFDRENVHERQFDFTIVGNRKKQVSCSLVVRIVYLILSYVG